MSHWVPETGPVSRCPEPSRINARISFAQYWRGHDPQRLYFAPSVPLCPYFHSHCKLCPAASTCDITPRDKTSHSSDWLSLQPISLCTVNGRTPSVYTEIPLVWNLAVDIVYAGNSNQWNISRESTHLAFVFFSIIAYCLIVGFLNDFCDFFCVFLSVINFYWCSFLKQALSYNENLCAL